MVLSLTQLLTKVTEAQAFATALEILTELGFPVTAWQEGRVWKTFTRLQARMYSELTGVIASYTAGGFPLLAKNAYADQLGTYHFDEPRIPAEETEGYVHLVSDLTAPSHSKAAGEVTVLIDGRRYSSIEALSLAPGAEADLKVRASIAGEAGNAPNDSACSFVTALVGVEITNPEYADGTWITLQGYDSETDERYMTRCIGKITRLEYGNTDGAYRAWTLEALPAVNRVTISPPTGDGTVRIVAATSEGALTAPQIATIEDYLNGSDGIGRRPINDVVSVETVTEVTTPALALTCYVDRSYAPEAAALVEDAIEALLAPYPIGGVKLTTGQGYVLSADLWRVVMAVPGMRNVTGIPSDILLGVEEVYEPAITVTVVAV